jgi:hypothetical protein
MDCMLPQVGRMIEKFVQRGSTRQKIDVAIDALENIRSPGCPIVPGSSPTNKMSSSIISSTGNYVDGFRFIAAVKLTFHASVAD